MEGYPEAWKSFSSEFPEGRTTETLPEITDLKTSFLVCKIIVHKMRVHGSQIKIKYRNCVKLILSVFSYVHVLHVD